MYGVCMMIYVFGDLRQLRSFELARVDGKDDTSRTGTQRKGTEAKPGVGGKEQGKRTWSVVFGVGRAETDPVARTRTRTPTDTQATLPFRKESLQPVVNPVPMLPPPPRALTVNTQIRGRPPLRLDTHAEQRNDGELIMPPRAVTVARAEDDVASLRSVLDNSEDESEFDDDEEEEEHTPRTRQITPPPIEISDAFYDEHPSPEGPATAPADWFPANLERLAAQRPVPLPQSGSPSGTPGVEGGENPLWPDYTTNEDWLSGGAGSSSARRGSERRGETALFIGPFVYDGSESSCAQITGGAKDEEQAVGEMDSVQAHQPMGGFDFDMLPIRRAKRGAAQKKKTNKQTKGDRREKEKEGQRKRRSLSPQSMISLSTNGKPERWYWALLEWWQLKCAPGNAVDVIEKREKEDTETEQRSKGKMRASEKDKREVDLEKSLPPPAPADTSKRRRNPGQWRLALRKVYLSVPAFASPLTPVLNPLVGRAQWEIVVRSAVVSLVVSCVVVGGLVGVPETHR